MLKIQIIFRKLERYLAFAIALITLAVFSPVLWHDFVNLDDPIIVTGNPYIQAGVTLEAIRLAFASAYESNWIPLTWMSHMLDVQMFGMNPAGHHFVSLLLHTASSVLLFLFLKRATKAPLKSAAVAFLFALHPLHVESVAWASERKDVLSTFFLMLTIYFYVLDSEKRSMVRYLAVVSSFIMGLLSKPMVVTLPVVMLLLDWWPLGRLSSDTEGSPPLLKSRFARLCVEKIPLLVLSIGSAIITYSVQKAAGEIVTDYSLIERAARACISYVEYSYRMIWPRGLSVFYPFVEAAPSFVQVCSSVVLLGAITFWVLRLRKSSPYLITGWLWYMVTLLPAIGLVQIGQHSIADRYTYIPLTGLFVIIAWGFPQLVERWQTRQKIIATVSAVGFVVMVTLTSLQLRYWKNSYTLLTHAIEVTENNYLALNNLGLTNLYDKKADDAIRLFKESLKARPSYVIALLNLAAAYSEKNEMGQAIDACIQALRFEPQNERTHLSLGIIYLKAGQRERAMGEYRYLEAAGSSSALYLLNEINAAMIRRIEHY
ncbi:MAG: tetratricopeptide repeat protein [Nitrospirae bacterium]|nr:tetratricopeptide repeat protein [Nitrospirota bacterium]